MMKRWTHAVLLVGAVGLVGACGDDDTEMMMMMNGPGDVVTDRFGYIIDDSPDNSGGTGESALFVGSSDGRSRRSLVRFDLSGIASGANQATVTAVTINLTVSRVPTKGPVASDFEFHRLLEDWAQGVGNAQAGTACGADGGVSWNETDCAGDNPWTAMCDAGETCGAGGFFVTEASATVAVGTTNGPKPLDSAANATLISDVQGWIDDPAQNFGWLILSSMEGVDLTARRLSRPTMTVTYSCDTGATNCTPPE